MQIITNDPRHKAHIFLNENLREDVECNTEISILKWVWIEEEGTGSECQKPRERLRWAGGEEWTERSRQCWHAYQHPGRSS